jgi:hypothetical protein
MKGFATFWMVWHVLLLKHQEAENLCRAVTWETLHSSPSVLADLSLLKRHDLFLF